MKGVHRWSRLLIVLFALLFLVTVTGCTAGDSSGSANGQTSIGDGTAKAEVTTGTLQAKTATGSNIASNKAPS